ncbi:spermidine/putrescine transport system permease protein [Roseovarius azorensis]|uniref:Spermidine/putrescine transport system permease protein n=1 Tax=Roseovarius azorensis TaxID=1287727 RepID=A0A1H7XG80_9RHOB|nr:ABC transporter permease [Roseovarius azorensis]SEM32731.1 spermidine/putrescine transport system permease protein [Roseovarius azorensis]
MSQVSPLSRKWLPLLPAVSWWAFFFLASLLAIIVYSFGVKTPLTALNPVSFDDPSLSNYREAFSSVYIRVFWITLKTAGIGTIACLMMAFPVAYVLATRVSKHWRSWLLFVIIFPYWVSFLLRTFAWRIILAPEGAFSEALQGLGIISAPLGILDTQMAVQMGIIYNYLPVAILPIFVALERIDPALRQASADVGANRVTTFFRITLPLATPGLIGAGVLTFILAAGDYVVPAILGGARGLMIGRLIALQILEAQNLPLGAAMAVVLIAALLATGAIAGLALIVLNWLNRKFQGASI